MRSRQGRVKGGEGKGRVSACMRISMRIQRVRGGGGSGIGARERVREGKEEEGVG